MENISKERLNLLKTFIEHPKQFYPETTEGKVDFQILCSYECIERNGDINSPFTITNSGQELLNLVK